MDRFDWDGHRNTLDKIFFRENDFIRKGTKNYDDFWLFFGRFRKFQDRATRDQSGRKKEKSEDEFNPRYKINCSVITKDMEKLMKQAKSSRRRDDDGEIPTERLVDFRSAVLHYIDFCQKQNFRKLKKLRKSQENLPIAKFKKDIVNAVIKNEVVIVAGDTGCGKSTQVPQYLMQAGFQHIACTQPRRIAAISLSKRVAIESLNQHSSEVAYQIRFDGTKTRATKIVFLTEGLLLRQIQNDPHLSQYDVIILDEIHERHLQSDFLLGLLKRLIEGKGGHKNEPDPEEEEEEDKKKDGGKKVKKFRRKNRDNLRLILMSATINLDLFSSYFPGSPVIQVPGRLFPIQLEYLPIKAEEKSSKTSRIDPRPYLKILQQIDKKYPADERGDLLVFLPGMQEITTIEEAMRPYAEETRRWIILALHSTLSSDDQDRVFDHPPDGARKCILSTNIAETSVTVDGVRFVADSGRVKEMSYDVTNKMKKLQEFWISRASAEQRKGRAGRTGPGVCFRLFAEEDYEALADYAVPEIRRVPLDSLVLQMKSMDIENVRGFPFIEAPPESAMDEAISSLIDHRALDGGSEKMTPLGEMLAQLPVDVAVGKMLIMGSLFDIIDPVMSIAACLSVQSPYTRRAYNDVEAATRRRPLESDHGDPITLLNLFDEWIQIKGQGKTSSKKWCKRRGLEEQRFYEITNVKKQFQQLLDGNSLLRKVTIEKRLTSHQRQQRFLDKRRLYELKKSEKEESRRKKILKVDESKYQVDDASDDDVTSAVDDVRDLEFRLRHDLDQMCKDSSERRSLTMRDIVMLKIILTSGIYPQLALLDDNNSYVNGTDQIVHTKNKKFVVLHPNSYFANHPHIIEPKGRDDDEVMTSSSTRHQRGLIGHKHQLLTFVSLLETKKPYLCNTMRVPALQTLLLFSSAIDTNVNMTRLVADEWLEIFIKDETKAQDLVVSTLLLRKAWNKLLNIRIKSHKKKKTSTSMDDEVNEVRGKEIIQLQRHLTDKISQFLDSKIEYQIRRIRGSGDGLYVGKGENMEDDVIMTKQGGSLTFPMSEASPHPTKGGISLTDFLTYNCLVPVDQQSSRCDFLREFWTCPVCDVKLPMTISERVRHQAICGLEKPEETDEKTEEEEKESSNIPTTDGTTRGRAFHCHICNLELHLSAVGILKHKRSHQSTSV